MSTQRLSTRSSSSATCRAPAARSSRAIRQVRPGHLLTWDRGSRRIEDRLYWSPPAPVTQLKESPRELAAEAGRLLERSIRGRLLADVPLGVFLSGGVDSTVIAAIAAQQSSQPLKTFTVGYEGGDGVHDERQASREMAALLGSEHRDIAMSKSEAAARVPALLSTLDQPLADSALVALHAVAEFATAEVTVAIGGEGADELFGGYPRYRWLSRRSEADDLSRLVSSEIRRRIPRATSASPRMPACARTGGPPPARRAAPRLGHRRPPPRQVGAATAPACSAHSNASTSSPTSSAISKAPGPTRSPDRLMRLDQLHWLPDDVLVKADRAGMLASLEMRTPYLQRELAEFATSVAPSTHLSGGGKQLLRLLLSQLVPDAPRRRKVAFLPPIAEWLRGSLGAVMEEQVAAGSLYSEGWVRGDVTAAAPAPTQAWRRRPQPGPLAPAGGGPLAGSLPGHRAALMRTLAPHARLPAGARRHPAPSAPRCQPRHRPRVPGRHPRHRRRGRVRPRRQPGRQTGPADARHAATDLDPGAQRGGGLCRRPSFARRSCSAPTP